MLCVKNKIKIVDKIFLNYYILRKQMADQQMVQSSLVQSNRMRGNGRRPRNAIRFESRMKLKKDTEVKYADAGRQNLVLNV